MSNDITIIADNGGNITLQVIHQPTGYRWQHLYCDGDIGADVARDIRSAQAGANPAVEWEGNDLDAAPADENWWLEPTTDELANGGYQTYSVAEIEALDSDEIGWRNVADLHDALMATAK